MQVCVCAVCGLYDKYSIRSIEKDLRRPVTVWVLDGLPLTVIGCGRHPLTEGSRSLPDRLLLPSRPTIIFEQAAFVGAERVPVAGISPHMPDGPQRTLRMMLKWTGSVCVVVSCVVAG